jgi:hypothetical protein
MDKASFVSKAEENNKDSLDDLSSSERKNSFDSSVIILNSERNENISKLQNFKSASADFSLEVENPKLEGAFSFAPEKANFDVLQDRDLLDRKKTMLLPHIGSLQEINNLQANVEKKKKIIIHRRFIYFNKESKHFI